MSKDPRISLQGVHKGMEDRLDPPYSSFGGPSRYSLPKRQRTPMHHADYRQQELRCMRLKANRCIRKPKNPGNLNPNLFRQTLFLLTFSICLVTGRSEIELLSSSIVDPNGLNFAEGDATRFSLNINGRTYQRPPLNTFKGYQYVSYYDKNRNVCLGRRKLPDGEWEILRFTDYTMPGSDSHNVVTHGICAKDGTIHLSFDNHADLFNYRVSEPKVALNPETIEWSVDLFGPVENELGSLGSIERFTYPYFFNAPNGNLMLYYREGGSGNGQGMIQEYDGDAGEWTTGLGRFIASTGSYTGALSTNSQSRNPYLNGISYAGNRIHVSWGWRESSGGAQFNHDICYAYSDDNGRTWRNNDGIIIAHTGSSFITVDSPGLVVASIPQNQGLSNQYTQYAYEDGSCHVIVSHNEQGTSDRRYHHYWRDAGGSWNGAARGAVYIVETSDSLSPGSWSSDGVIQDIVSESGNIQTVTSIIPAPENGPRFVKLSVNR